MFGTGMYIFYRFSTHVECIFALSITISAPSRAAPAHDSRMHVLWQRSEKPWPFMCMKTELPRTRIANSAVLYLLSCGFVVVNVDRTIHWQQTWFATGTNELSLNVVADLSRTREMIKGGVALIVNGDTLLFLTSSPGEVQSLWTCIQQAAVSAAYILSYQYDLPIETPFWKCPCTPESGEGIAAPQS